MATAASYHRMIKILMKMVPGRPHAWVETVSVGFEFSDRSPPTTIGIEIDAFS